MLVFGVGFGVVILSTLWCLTIFGCIVAGRTKGMPSIVGLNLLAAIITISLISWPIKTETEVENQSLDETPQIDLLFVPRLFFVIFLFILIIYLVYRSIAMLFLPIRLKPLRQKI